MQYRSSCPFLHDAFDINDADSFAQRSIVLDTRNEIRRTDASFDRVLCPMLENNDLDRQLRDQRKIRRRLSMTLGIGE